MNKYAKIKIIINLNQKNPILGTTVMASKLVTRFSVSSILFFKNKLKLIINRLNGINQHHYIIVIYIFIKEI